MDFGQRGVILTLGEVRSFIRKPYIHSYVTKGNTDEKNTRHTWASFK